MTVTQTGERRQIAGAESPTRGDDPLRQLLLPRLEGVRPAGGGYAARCPAHDDKSPSLSVGYGNTQPVVVTCHAGCGRDDILSALGLSWSDLCTPRASRTSDDFIVCGWNGKTFDFRHRKVAEYLYRDAAGNVVFGVARCALKGTEACQGFRQWRPDPQRRSGRRWTRRLADGTTVGDGLIYRLPDVLDSDANSIVYVVEGEKDADRLWAIGTPATCSSQGAGKWTDVHAGWLVGRDVIVVADRDDAGWAHAEIVVNTLLTVARSIEVVRAHTGKDVSDHLDAGLQLSHLVRVAEPKPAPGISADGTDLEAVA